MASATRHRQNGVTNALLHGEPEHFLENRRDLEPSVASGRAAGCLMRDNLMLR